MRAFHQPKLECTYDLSWGLALGLTPVWAFWVADDNGVAQGTLAAPRFELALEPKFPALTTLRYTSDVYGLWSVDGTVTTEALAARLIMQVGLPTETSRLPPCVIAAIHAKASILYMAATKFAVVGVAGTLALVRVTCLSPYKGYVKGTPGTTISFEEGTIFLPAPHIDGISALSDLTAADTAAATATAATIFSRRTRLLPEDLLELTFRSLVPPELLVSCLSVCKTWRRVALRLLHFHSHDGKAEAEWSQCLVRDAEDLSASISVDVVRNEMRSFSDNHDSVAHPIVFRAVLMHRLKVHVARPASLKTIETQEPDFLDTVKGVLKMNQHQIDCTQRLAAVLSYLVTLLGVQMRPLVRYIVKMPSSVDPSSIPHPAVAIVDTITDLLCQLVMSFGAHDACLVARCGRVYARKLFFSAPLYEIRWLQDSVFLPAVALRGDDDRRMYPPTHIGNTLRAIIRCAHWATDFDDGNYRRGVLDVARICQENGRALPPLAVMGILNYSGLPSKKINPSLKKRDGDSSEVPREALEASNLVKQSLFAIDFIAVPFDECVSVLRVFNNESYSNYLSFVRELDLLEFHPALPSITTGHVLESDLNYICGGLGMRLQACMISLKAECDLEGLQRVEVHVPSRLRSILGRLANVKAAVYVASMLVRDIARPDDLEQPEYCGIATSLLMTRFRPKVRHAVLYAEPCLAKAFAFIEEDKEDGDLPCAEEAICSAPSDARAEDLLRLVLGVCRRDTDIAPLDEYGYQNAEHVAARARALRECGMAPWLSGDAFSSDKMKATIHVVMEGFCGQRGDTDRYLLGHELGNYVSLLELLTERSSNLVRTQFLMREFLLHPIARLEAGTIEAVDLRVIVVGIAGLVKCKDERMVPALRRLLRTLAQGVPLECQDLAVSCTVLLTRFWLDEEHRDQGFSLTCPVCADVCTGGNYLAKFRRSDHGQFCPKCKTFVGPRLLRYEPGYVTRGEVLAVLQGIIIIMPTGSGREARHERTKLLALQVFERLVELGDTDDTSTDAADTLAAALSKEGGDVQLRFGTSLFTASPSPDALLHVLQLLECNAESEPLLCMKVFVVLFHKVLLGDDVARDTAFHEVTDDGEGDVNVVEVRPRPWAGAVTGAWVRPLYEGMRRVGFLTEDIDEEQRTQQVRDCLFARVIVDALQLSKTLMIKHTDDCTLEAVVSLVHRMCAFLTRDLSHLHMLAQAWWGDEGIVVQTFSERVVGTLLLNLCISINSARTQMLECDYKRDSSQHEGHVSKLMRLLFDKAVVGKFEDVWQALRSIRGPLNTTLAGYTQQSARESFNKFRPNTSFFLPQLVLMMEGDHEGLWPSTSLDSMPGVLHLLRWWVRELTTCYEHVFKDFREGGRKADLERLDRISVTLMLMSQPDAKAIDRALEYLIDYIGRAPEDADIAATWADHPVLAETTAAASELEETSRTYRRLSERVVAAYRRARGLHDDDNDDDGSENGEDVPDA